MPRPIPSQVAHLPVSWANPSPGWPGGFLNGANGAPPPLLAQPQSVGSQGLRGRPPVVLSRSCGRLNRCLPRWVALHGLGEHPQSVRYSCVLQAPRRCVSGWPQRGQARRMPPSRRFVIFQMSSPGRMGGIPSHLALISDGEPTRCPHPVGESEGGPTRGDPVGSDKSNRPPPVLTLEKGVWGGATLSP